MTNQIKVINHIKENKVLFLLLVFILLGISFLEYWLMPEWSKRLLEILVDEQAGHTLWYVLKGMLYTATMLGILGILKSWSSMTIILMYQQWI